MHAPSCRSRLFRAAAGASVLLTTACNNLPVVSTARGSDPVDGFAGTIVRYADRDYKGASWQKWYAAANLGNLPVLGIRTVDLRRILGVDEDNLWVVDSKGVVFRRVDGHWKLSANQPDASDPLVEVIDPDTLLMSGYRSRQHVYLVGSNGVRTVTYQGLQQLRPTDAVTPIAPDLSYIHGYRQTYKLLENALSRVSPGTSKDSIVVDDFGAPVNIANAPMTPTDVRFSATFSPGEAYAVWLRPGRGARLVEHRDGAWVMLEEIAIPPSELRNISAAWISRDDEGNVFVLFAAPAGATLYRQGEGVTTYPLSGTTGGARVRLLEVWGSGPGTFWVMDERGSIWERRAGEWRQIVLAPGEEDFRLQDAWISPTGVVFAITRDALYRLGS